MSQNNETARAFASFRALESEAQTSERNQLFRNMAQLFSFVSDRCEDSQVEQYDEVLAATAKEIDCFPDRSPLGIIVRSISFAVFLPVCLYVV